MNGKDRHNGAVGDLLPVEKAAVAANEKILSVTVPVRGMSCSSCVAKIEKSLNRLPGVSQAVVNFATEKASVSYYPSIHSVADLTKAIRDIGYEALDPIEDQNLEDYENEAREREIRELRF